MLYHSICTLIWGEREKLKMGSKRICMNIEAWCWIGLVVWLWWLENNWGHMQHTAGPGRRGGGRGKTEESLGTRLILQIRIVRKLYNGGRFDPSSVSQSTYREHGSVCTVCTRRTLGELFPMVFLSARWSRHQASHSATSQLLAGKINVCAQQLFTFSSAAKQKYWRVATRKQICAVSAARRLRTSPSLALG